MNKKAISPLIATVLLIGFAVALAAVVMTWGGGFIRKTTESTESQAETTLLCATTLNFDVKAKSDCSGIIIDNKCDLEIKSILLKIHRGTEIETQPDAITDIKAYDTKDAGIILDATITKVEAIATIMSEGREITCGQSPRETKVRCGGEV